METRTRTVAKAVSWQLLGLMTMMLIGFFFTGSVEGSLGVALSSCVTGFVCFLGHERAWQHVSWGKRS